MSALTEHVPAASLQKDDFVTLPQRRDDPFDGPVLDQVLGTVRRVTVLQESDRILVDYYDIVTGIPGTADLGPDDLVLRVRESEAS